MAPPSRVRINVLGPLEIVDLDQEMLVPARGQLALFVRFLVVRAGQDLSIDALMGLIATVRRVPAGLEQLRSDVHGLKLRAARLLGTQRITTRRADNTFYGFQLADGDSTDLLEFDELVSAARGAVKDDPSAALTAAERAVSLWRGNPAGPYDDGVLTDGLGADHFNARLLAAEQVLCQALIQVGSRSALERAVEIARELVRHPDHRFEESLHFLQAEALLALGNESAAVEVFDNFVYSLGGKASLKFQNLIRRGKRNDPGAAHHMTAASPSFLEWLADTDRAVRNRKIQGGHRLHVGDLVDHRLLLPFIAADEQHTSVMDLQHVMEQAALAGSPHGRLLVTGSPGIGKSTLLFSLYLRLRSKLDGPGDHARTVPFILDLRQFRDAGVDPDFGSAAWLRERFETLGLPDTRVFLMLDSLDEFMAGRQHRDVISLLERPLFLRANVICCREVFYDRHLRSGSFSLSRDVLTLQAWSPSQLTDYAGRFYRHCFPDEANALLAALRSHLEARFTLSEVCSTPMRANMLLHLLSPGPEPRTELSAVSSVIDLPSLYRAWIHRTLEAESSRMGAVLTAGQKGDILRSLAWTFYDESPVDQDDPPNFTVEELNRHVRGAHVLLGGNLPDVQVANVVSDLIDHSLLVESTLLPYHDSAIGMLNFSHKSFQEFLVADHIMRAVLSDEAKLRQLFERYHSPEVVEFLRDMVTCIPPGSRTSRVMVQIFLAAFTRSAAGQDQDETRNARSQLALSQLAYIMANVPDQRVLQFLLRYLELESDPWLRRSVIVGLSFAGQIDLLDGYIDRLRAERQAGGPALENEVNVGAQLSYFGDQPLDLLLPARDQGMPVCRRTLQRLIYQLQTSTHQASWRLDLYSLLDIATRRVCSLDEAAEILRRNRQLLRRLSDEFEVYPQCANWPEINELRAALDGL
ncbi:BTAD domain-containing putative transcriptional regulator [Lentzea sp. NPDC054927]